MTKRIKFFDLTEFHRLRDIIHCRFGRRLCAFDQNVKLQARSEAIEFLRSNGFNVDDELNWVTWEDPREYTLALLKWT